MSFFLNRRFHNQKKNNVVVCCEMLFQRNFLNDDVIVFNINKKKALNNIRIVFHSSNFIIKQPSEITSKITQKGIGKSATRIKHHFLPSKGISGMQFQRDVRRNYSMTFEAVWIIRAFQLHARF